MGQIPPSQNTSFFPKSPFPRKFPWEKKSSSQARPAQNFSGRRKPTNTHGRIVCIRATPNVSDINTSHESTTSMAPESFKLSHYLFSEQAGSSFPDENSVKLAIESGEFVTGDGQPVLMDSIQTLMQHSEWLGYDTRDAYRTNLRAGNTSLSQWHLHTQQWPEEDDRFEVYYPYCSERKPTNPLFPKVLYAGAPRWAGQSIAFIEPLERGIDPSIVEKAIKNSHQPGLERFGYDSSRYGLLDLGTIIEHAMRTFLGHAASSDSPEEAKFRQSFKGLVMGLGLNVKQFVEFLGVLKDMGAPSRLNVTIDYKTMARRKNGELVMMNPVGFAVT